MIDYYEKYKDKIEEYRRQGHIVPPAHLVKNSEQIESGRLLRQAESGDIPEYPAPKPMFLPGRRRDGTPHTLGDGLLGRAVLSDLSLPDDVRDTYRDGGRPAYREDALAIRNTAPRVRRRRRNRRGGRRN